MSSSLVSLLSGLVDEVVESSSDSRILWETLDSL